MAEPLDIARIRSDIQQLAYRFAVAVDSRNIKMLASLYMPEDGSDPEAFQKQFYEIRKQRLAKAGISFLNVGTHLIDDITETSATGLVYCKSEFDVAGQWVEQAILYRDRYVCVDSNWYFTDRQHQLWYGAPRGTINPLEQPLANWPESQIGLGTVPGTFETWHEFWRDVHGEG
jgi:hypothetical protein